MTRTTSCVSAIWPRGEVTGSNYFLLRLRHAHSGGPSHSEIMTAIERFGKGVIPHLGG